MDQRHRHLVCKVREPYVRACVPQHVWDRMHAARSQALPASVHARGRVLTPSHAPSLQLVDAFGVPENLVERFLT